MENRPKRGQGGSEVTIWEAITVNPEDDSEISEGGDPPLDSGCIFKDRPQAAGMREGKESEWL